MLAKAWRLCKQRGTAGPSSLLRGVQPPADLPRQRPVLSPHLIALGLLMEGWALLSLDPLPGEDLQRYVFLFLGAWVLYAATLWLVLGSQQSAVSSWFSPKAPRERGPESVERTVLRIRLDLGIIFFFAILLRSTFLLAPPSLSDDIFRAAWDARLVHAGVNPYLYPPGAPELEPYRDDAIWPRVNHKEQRTPYLPLAEELGALAYLLGPERLISFQLLSVGLDLLAAAFLAWLLWRIGQDPRRCLALAWSPAGIVHFAHSGHNDSAMVLGLVGAGLLLAYRRNSLAMAALAAAAMVKAVPVLAMPMWARACRAPGNGRQRAPLAEPLGGRRASTGSGLSSVEGSAQAALARALAAWVATCLLVALPFMGAGPTLIAGLTEEGLSARFNDSLHWLVERTAAAVGVGFGEPLAAAVGVAVLGVAVLAGLRTADRSVGATVAMGCRLLGVYILVAPVVQPWYATWLAPLIGLELRARRGFPPLVLNDAVAWLWFTGAVALTELTYAPEGQVLWPLIRAVEYVPLYGLLGLAAVRAWRGSPEG